MNQELSTLISWKKEHNPRNENPWKGLTVFVQNTTLSVYCPYKEELDCLSKLSKELKKINLGVEKLDYYPKVIWKMFAHAMVKDCFKYFIKVTLVVSLWIVGVLGRWEDRVLKHSLNHV